MFTHFSCLLVVACVTVTSASPVKKRDAVPLEEFKLHITSLSNLDLITIAYDGNDYYDDWSKAPKQDYSTGDYIKWGNGPSEEGRTREQHGTIAAIRFESIPTSESPMRVLVEKEAADGRPAQTMNVSGSIGACLDRDLIV